MAVLWPRKLPRSVLNDSRRHAEVRVFNKLSEVLDDNFSVFYSSPWLGTDWLGNEKDGECDFLVAHPEYGILAIEVKGGGVSFDPTETQWRSKDRHGFVHRIKDPVAQARGAKHEILNRLNTSTRWRKRHIHAVHGVIFPDAGRLPSEMGLDRPAKIFCCCQTFRSEFRKWIGDRMNEGCRPDNCQPLGKDGIKVLETLLAQPFTLNFRIGAALAETESEFSILEPIQFQILETIADIPRALIRGGAGTGKTIVAIEEAILSAQKGRKTLITCFNRPLASNIERQLKETPNVTVANFHSLCGNMAKKANIQIPSTKNPEFYTKLLPNALYNALELLPEHKWDTVIVDEGQDFLSDWWIAIDACLSRTGILRVFMDCNQNVYNSTDLNMRDLDMVPIRLSRNLRNTKQIHSAASKHYCGPEITAGGPSGLDVSWIEEEDDILKFKTAFQEIQRLVFKEEVPPSDIAVLLNGPHQKDSFLEICAKTSIPISNAEDLFSGALVIDTVRRFKGLERPAIIVIISGQELEQRELAYVAFSRARTFLCVISSNMEARWLAGKDALTQDS